MANLSVPWKMGVEVELLAPPGRSRLHLAESIARHHGGGCRRIFHAQGEPSKVPGNPVFDNLTLGFVVEDAQDALIAKCVDDLTLQDDLTRETPARPGWYRIVSDDARLLRLIERHADPEAPLEEVLRPIADLFGGTMTSGEGGMVRVADAADSSIAIGAPLPGERERPCELITPPMETDQFAQLEDLLRLARSLEFGAPTEGAVHLHFDAAPLRSARTIANLVALLDAHRDRLKSHLGTNPRCRRLAPFPPELCTLIASPGFADLPWDEARAKLEEIELTKYSDFNLLNLVREVPDKNTFEVRILPVWLEADKIMQAASLFTSVLEWAMEGEHEPGDIPSELGKLT